jgi:hypothetical protein
MIEDFQGGEIGEDGELVRRAPKRGTASDSDHEVDPEELKDQFADELIRSSIAPKVPPEIEVSSMDAKQIPFLSGVIV